MKISDEILAILSKCKVENNTLFLPPGQLDRTTYLAVNRCLVNIGGKWNRKEKGHVFDHNPSDDLDSMLLTGETVDMKKIYQFFPYTKGDCGADVLHGGTGQGLRCSGALLRTWRFGRRDLCYWCC